MEKEGEHMKKITEKTINLSIENYQVYQIQKFKHEDTSIHNYTRETQPWREILSIIKRDNGKYVKDDKVIRQDEIGNDHYLLRTDKRQKQTKTQEKSKKKVKE